MNFLFAFDQASQLLVPGTASKQATTSKRIVFVGNQDFVLKLGDPSAILRCWHGRGRYHHNLLWSFHQTKCVINELVRTERNGVGGRPTDPPVPPLWYEAVVCDTHAKSGRYLRTWFAVYWARIEEVLRHWEQELSYQCLDFLYAAKAPSLSIMI